LVRFLEDPTGRAEIGAANRAYVLEHHDARRQSARMQDAFLAAG
jgi:hypothetical protein